MNLFAGESVDGESASQFVTAENDTEDIFFEAKENHGSNWKARGILPVLVLFNALNWASNFPSIPTVIRGPLADTLCDLSPQVKAFWNHGHVLFKSFQNRFDAVVHATSFQVWITKVLKVVEQSRSNLAMTVYASTCLLTFQLIRRLF